MPGWLWVRREGHHVEQFEQNFAGDKRITIPRVYWEYSNGRVLTLERMSGLKVVDVAALDEAGIPFASKQVMVHIPGLSKEQPLKEDDLKSIGATVGATVAGAEDEILPTNVDKKPMLAA